MMNNKRIIGVCITKIHDIHQITYLKHLHRYVQKHNSKLIIFNSFSDFDGPSNLHTADKAIFDMISFECIDALVIHSKSFDDNTLTNAVLERAKAAHIPVLSEQEFLPSEEEDYESFASDAPRNTAFQFHHVIMDALHHEDFMYSWLAQIVSLHDINELYSLLSEAILYGSHICLNSNIIDLLLGGGSGKADTVSEELIVISSRPSPANPKYKDGLKRSDFFPNHDAWEKDSTAYILTTIHANNKVYGYYAFRTDDFSVMIPPLKRVVSALNLAFCIVANHFRHTDVRLNIKQAILEDTDSHLPLNLLIEKNLFFYHFQPIVDAHTGAIFAYEALMRTDPVIYMTPLEVIDSASTYGRLYDIEKATMWNTLSYINEHPEFFEEHKLFVNSIPAHMLTTEDWDSLVNKFGHLMDKLVIEMTEQTEMDTDHISVIRDRLKQHNISLAIDDYGTGFSNISNLIRYSPSYVKIDRSLIENIQEKPRIQKLVAGIIEFVHENGYYALAEGVESHEELKTMIALGCDFVQGFYLANPASYILQEISEKLQNEIIELNVSRSESGIRVYSPEKGETVDLSKIVTKHYNTLLIETEDVIIQGAGNTPISCPIMIRDNLKTHITMKNLCITTEKGIPLIDLGDGSDVTISIEGKNELLNRGIRVPQSSSLHLTGEGSLHIFCEMMNSYGIGNDKDSSYGNIHIANSGTLSITIDGEYSVAVGGWKNANHSTISIQNTRLELDCSGNNCVGIGNFDGNCILDLNHFSCDIKMGCAYAIAIGSFTGSTDIRLTHYSISIVESGIGLCGIGVLSKGEGTLTASDGYMSIDSRGRNIVCFGSDYGNLNCSLLHSFIKFYCEGNVVTGIGDINGGGEIHLGDINTNITILSQNCLDIGNKYGSVKTENIQKNIHINE